MQNLARAKARARVRTANDNIVRLAPALELTAAYVIPEDTEEAPFFPPPADDILGVAECEDEEETIFVAEPMVEAIDETPDEPPPFDPPEFDDEPVFSAPAILEAPPPKSEIEPAPQKRREAPRDRPLPAISIFAAWERSESEALLQNLSTDSRFARATMEIARGGVESAIARCADGECPDLFILDTTLQNAPMLASLDRLIAAMAPSAKIVVIGEVNDIGLLRDLAVRGVCDYIVPPTEADAVARSLCALFADYDAARVIAVVGARGGIGASTIARNVAWSIAERQRQNTTLVDCDLSFGLAAFGFQQEAPLSVSDVLRAEADSEDMLTRALGKVTPRLQLLSAPQKVESADISVEAFETLVAQVRRTSAYVVLDVPHIWEPWVRSALRNADEIVMVAGADLASLRNADSMLKLLRSERDKVSAPHIVISMAGIPKRPEIPVKDFTEALCTKPVLTFAFEPDLFVSAEESGAMIHEAMPDAKAALQMDTLATLLTGRDAFARPEPRKRDKEQSAAPIASVEAKPLEAAGEPAPEALPVLDLVVLAPVETAPASNNRRRRRGARSGFEAVQRPAPPPAKHSRGIVRTALAALFLALACAWEIQQQQAAMQAPAPDSPRAFSV